MGKGVGLDGTFDIFKPDIPPHCPQCAQRKDTRDFSCECVSPFIVDQESGTEHRTLSAGKKRKNIFLVSLHFKTLWFQIPF